MGWPRVAERGRNEKELKFNLKNRLTTMSKSISGSCLCGKIKCEVHGPFQRFYQCYCDRCQKRTGSAFASMIFADPDKIEWLSGKELATRYDLPEAEKFSTCFCSKCGSPVPYISRNRSFLIIPAGFIEGDPEIRPSANIFWNERSCW